VKGQNLKSELFTFARLSFLRQRAAEVLVVVRNRFPLDRDQQLYGGVPRNIFRKRAKLLRPRVAVPRKRAVPIITSRAWKLERFRGNKFTSISPRSRTGLRPNIRWNTIPSRTLRAPQNQPPSHSLPGHVHEQNQPSWL
jgi:hypothetical protein